VNKQEKMTIAFRAIMAKLTIIGKKRSDLVDCSEAVPEPIPASGKPST
jgi:manganese peroxidase